jgi:hypothetical protein
MKYLLFVLQLVVALSLQAQTTTPPEYVEKIVPAVGTRDGFVAYIPKVLVPGKQYPLLFVLHGIGEQKGRVSLQQLGAHPLYTPAETFGKQYGFIIIEPQTCCNWQYGEVEEAYQWFKDSMFAHVNWKKVALTGVSLGGGGVYRYLSINPNAHLLFSAASPNGSGPKQYFVTAANEINVINTKVPIWAFHNKGDSVAQHYKSTSYFLNKWKSSGGTAEMWVTMHELMGHTFPAYNRGIGSTVISGLKAYVGTNYVSMPAVNIYEWILMQEIGKPAVAPTTKVVSYPTDGPGIPDPVVVSPTPVRIGKLRGLWVGDDPMRPGHLKIEAHYTTGIQIISPPAGTTSRSVWIPMDTTKSYTPTVTTSTNGTFTIPARK